jgi:hypothetical protein
MKHVIFMIAALVMLTGTAAGQMEMGDREIQFSGMLVTLDGFTMINLNLLYGYFYSEKLEIGGGPGLTHTGSDYYDETTFSLVLFGRYNFTIEEKLVPYVGGRWYQYDFAPDDPVGFFDVSFIQAQAGFKYFLNENVAYDVSGNLGFGLGSGDASFAIIAGVSAFF